MDARTIAYVVQISCILGDQIDLPVSTDTVLEEIALHMDGCGMCRADQLMDGNVGGIESLGGREEFCMYIAERYKVALQRR
ncbi:hypothetical protein HYV88_02570 [Candidatus Woesearchaeota archaeon]|nr:hypothetical protein [Candidatus Woesearchaeota archaeon]